MFEGFSTEAKRAIVLAQGAARAAGAELISCAHLLYGLLAAGGEAAERLAPLGLTAEAVSAHGDADGTQEMPPPMTLDEAREFRRQLRARGITAAKAEQLFFRIQRQRSTGPVEFDERAAAVLKSRASDSETTTAALLRAMFASPPPDVAALIAAAGTTADEVRRALSGP